MTGRDRDDLDRPRGADASGTHLERRGYLTLAAGATLAGLVGPGAMAAQDGGETVEITAADEGEDWEAAADERIREHRTAPLSVRVTDREGQPLPGASVRVEMREHEYGFGTAVSAPTLMEAAEDDPYREHIPELFNKAVLENYHKWRFWEENQEVADDATEWILEQGLELRGHACLWANPDVGAIPADVEDALEEGDGEYVNERALEHVEAIISYYGDDVVEWDVVNEATHEPGFSVAVDGSNVDPVEAPSLAAWYERARAVADEVGSQVAVNDYNVLTGPNLATRDLYERQIEFLTGEGIDLDGIGLQSHFSADTRLDPDQILEGVNRYAGYGAEIRATEFDTYQGAWESPEEQAQYLHTFLKTFFSHPATADFLIWGFWDGRHWRDDAPLFFEDWEPKPAYDVYTDLVFEEWWTEEAGETDGDGRFEVHGFRGEYEVTASYDGETGSDVVDLGASGGSATVELDVEAPDTTDRIPGFGVPAAVAALAALSSGALARLRGEND